MIDGFGQPDATNGILRIRTQPSGFYLEIQGANELIASTTTKTGLTVRCELDTRSYPKGIKVSDAEMITLNIKGHTFHPEWNYTISPRVPE